MSARNLLLIGASVRAAAQSAARAGFDVCGIDLFGDIDLLACARAIRSVDYPDDMPRLAASAPPGDWLFTGGLENHSEVVANISAQRRLLGNTPETLRRVRDPVAVQRALAKASFPAIDTRLDIADLPGDGTWLCKPLRSAGGGQIRFVGESAKSSDHVTARNGKAESERTHFFQRFIAGDAISAVFVSASRTCRLLGVTQQLVAAPWCHAGAFQYAGSIGPFSLESPAARSATPEMLEQVAAIGAALTTAFDLAGVWGIDGVINDNQFWTVEVNPRYTASCEIIERMSGRSVIADHVSACRAGELPPPSSTGPSRKAAGKAILFAPTAVTFGGAAIRWVENRNAMARGRPLVADIPAEGTKIDPGQPILTVLCDGESVGEVHDALRRAADEFYAAVRM